MKAWEYNTEIAPAAHCTDRLNDLGFLGWELCGIHNNTWIFKREIYKPGSPDIKVGENDS